MDYKSIRNHPLIFQYFFSLVNLTLNMVMFGLIFYKYPEQFIIYKGLTIGMLFGIFLFVYYLFSRYNYLLPIILNIISLSTLILWTNNLVRIKLENSVESIDENSLAVIFLILFLLGLALIINFKSNNTSSAYYTLLIGYSVVAIIAHLFSFSLLYFSISYLFSIIIFNLVIFLRQFLCGTAIDLSRIKDLRLIFGFYLLTLFIFLVNELYETPLNKALQPYYLKERISALQTALFVNEKSSNSISIPSHTEGGEAVFPSIDYLFNLTLWPVFEVDVNSPELIPNHLMITGANTKNASGFTRSPSRASFWGTNSIRVWGSHYNNSTSAIASSCSTTTSLTSVWSQVFSLAAWTAARPNNAALENCYALNKREHSTKSFWKGQQLSNACIPEEAQNPASNNNPPHPETALSNSVTDYDGKVLEEYSSHFAQIEYTEELKAIIKNLAPEQIDIKRFKCNLVCIPKLHNHWGAFSALENGDRVGMVLTKSDTVPDEQLTYNPVQAAIEGSKNLLFSDKLIDPEAEARAKKKVGLALTQKVAPTLLYITWEAWNDPLILEGASTEIKNNARTEILPKNIKTVREAFSTVVIRSLMLDQSDNSEKKESDLYLKVLEIRKINKN